MGRRLFATISFPASSVSCPFYFLCLSPVSSCHSVFCLSLFSFLFAPQGPIAANAAVLVLLTYTHILVPQFVPCVTLFEDPGLDLWSC